MSRLSLDRGLGMSLFPFVPWVRGVTVSFGPWGGFLWPVGRDVVVPLCPVGQWLGKSLSVGVNYSSPLYHTQSSIRTDTANAHNCKVTIGTPAL